LKILIALLASGLVFASPLLSQDEAGCTTEREPSGAIVNQGKPCAPSKVNELKKGQERIKVEVTEQAAEMGIKYQGGGVIGAAKGNRTYSEIYFVNVVIEKEHARLKCFENHRGCTAIGPGIYDGVLQRKDGDIWITINMPLTHVVVRDHWKVYGTW
jgi:hypothetical protein